MIDGVIYVAERLGKPNDQKCFQMLCEAAHTDQYLALTKYIVENWEFGVSKFESPEFAAIGYPQHHACECGALQTLKYLVEKGAHISLASTIARPPGNAMMAIYASNCSMMRGRSWSGASSAEMLDYISGLEGFDVNQQDEATGDTPLHQINFISSALKHLLSLGADVNIKNKEGKTVLDIVDEKLSGRFFEDAERFWKMYKLGKIKIPKNANRKRKAAEPGDDKDDDEPDAKRSKVENPVPEFHTITGARKLESGGWFHTLGDTELDEDDTGQFRSDKGQTPLAGAILEDLSALESEAATLAKRLGVELEGSVLASEADSPWTPFVITVPEKFKKATVIKLVQLALRAPKAPLKSSKFTAKDKSYFQEDKAASETATASMKENLTGIVQLEYKGEPICAPVIILGKIKGGTELVGAFALRVWT